MHIPKIQIATVNGIRGLVNLLFVALFAQSCATLMHGSTQQITVNSSPSGATILVDGGLHFTTPAVLELSRRESHRVEVSLDGYHTQLVELRTVSSNMAMGNLIAGGLVGYAVDHSTGAAFRLVPEVVHVSLKPLGFESPPVGKEVETTNTTNQPQPRSQ